MSIVKRLLIYSILLLSSLNLNANSLDFYYTLKRYYEIEEQQDFVELAYFIPGNVVAYNEIHSNQFQGQLLVSLDVVKNNENLLHYAYVIETPIYNENPNALSNLTDVINIPLTEDSAQLVLQVLDLNDSTSYFADNFDIQRISINEQFISDVALINSKKATEENSIYTKGNLELTPKFINYYPNDQDLLKFYVESYQKQAPFQKQLLKYFISDENNVVIDKYSNFKKCNPQEKDAFYAEFDISKLPSGNYYIYVELRNDVNEIIDRKRMFFQRTNTIAIEEQDKIDYYELDVINNNFAKKYDERNIIHHLKALRPIADEFEIAAIESAIYSEDISLMHNFFYTFWSTRDSKNPEDRWMEYAKLVQFVDQEFNGSLIEGHESQRGMVYLEYGPPMERIERNTPQYGRIELWRYEEINGRSQIVFLFIEVPTFDDRYQLVHSNLNNEIFSNEWDKILKSNNF